MKILRNIVVAFALYSKIPMPIFTWEKEDMEYNIAFLPLIGAVIGLVQYGLYILSEMYGLPSFAKVLIWTAVVLIITGGFHVDGFMDVCDASNSYKSKEEKLEILKDPHIGAFAVISLAKYGLLYILATYLMFERMADQKIFIIAATGFFLVRGAGALLSLILPHAKKSGMLHEETKEAGKVAIGIIAVELLTGVAFIIYSNMILGIAEIVAILLYSLIYRRKCMKEFGGVTGDCAGYFMVMGELVYVAVCAVYCLI